MEGRERMIGGVRYVLVADRRFWGGKRAMIVKEVRRSGLSVMGLCWTRRTEE